MELVYWHQRACEKGVYHQGEDTVSERFFFLFFVEMLNLFINKRKKFTIRKCLRNQETKLAKKKNVKLLIPSHPTNHQSTALLCTLVT